MIKAVHGSSAPGRGNAFCFLGANRVRYVTAGGGRQTLVFIDGWANHLGFWRGQVPAFTDQARLVLIDLPGHGQSDKPNTAYTMDFFASAVLAVLRAAQVDQATLIGHSMGGAVIGRVYEQAPETVAALVSVDGLLRRPQWPPAQARQFAAQFGAPEYREHARRFVGSFFPVPGTEALRDEVLAETLATPQYVMAGAMAGMFNPDLPDRGLKAVHAPVLVINARSPMWNADYENYIRSLSPRTEYRLMDGVGHWLMLEKPGEFNATLAELLWKHDLMAKSPG